LRAEKHERRRHYLAWYLWWEGYDVSMRRVREFIEAVAGGWDDGIAEREGKTPDELKEMVETEFGAEKRFSGDARILSRVRRRVGKEALPDYASSFLLPTSDNGGDAEQIIGGLGLQFLFDSLLGQKLLSAHDAEEVVQASRDATSTSYGERVAKLSDSDLLRGRSRVRAAFEQVQGLDVVFRQLLGEAGARALIDALWPAEAARQAILLLTLEPLLADPLYVGPKPPGDAITVFDLASAFEFFESLMREVPVLVDYEILTPRRLKAATHDAAQFERVALAVWGFARAEPREFDTFLEAHPEERPRVFPPGRMSESAG